MILEEIVMSNKLYKVFPKLLDICHHRKKGKGHRLFIFESYLNLDQKDQEMFFKLLSFYFKDCLLWSNMSGQYCFALVTCAVIL